MIQNLQRAAGLLRILFGPWVGCIVPDCSEEDKLVLYETTKWIESQNLSVKVPVSSSALDRYYMEAEREIVDTIVKLYSMSTVRDIKKGPLVTVLWGSKLSDQFGEILRQLCNIFKVYIGKWICRNKMCKVDDGQRKYGCEWTWKNIFNKDWRQPQVSIGWFILVGS